MRIGAVEYVNPETGLVEQRIAVKGFRIRTRLYPVTVSTGDPDERPPTPFGDQLLTAADQSAHFDRALYLFGALSPDWRGLYMVLEAAEDANGGESGLIAKGWVPTGQIGDFKNTANSYKALRLAARHGSLKTGTDNPKLTLEEAREMIRTILNQWSKSVV